jgi:hypothetical protein
VIEKRVASGDEKRQEIKFAARHCDGSFMLELDVDLMQMSKLVNIR